MSHIARACWIGSVAGLLVVTSGCGTKIGAFYAARDPSAGPPRLGVGRYLLVYHSMRHSDENTLEGWMEKGLRGLTGDQESIPRMRRHGEDLRDANIEELHASLSQFDGFAYEDHRKNNPDALVPEVRQSLRQYAKAYGYDLVLCVHTLHEGGGIIGPRLGADSSWFFYDSEGKYLGRINSSANEKLAKGTIDFDARDPEYREQYRRILARVFEENLAKFRQEMGKGSGR
jgi:hypothetical protein